MIELALPFIPLTIDESELECIKHPKANFELCFWHQMTELPPNQSYAIWTKEKNGYRLIESEQYSLTPRTSVLFSSHGKLLLLPESDEGHVRYFIYKTDEYLLQQGITALGVLDDFALMSIESFSDKGEINYKADCTYSQTEAASGDVCIRNWSVKSEY